jgi:hypothetical protein
VGASFQRSRLWPTTPQACSLGGLEGAGGGYSKQKQDANLKFMPMVMFTFERERERAEGVRGDGLGWGKDPCV